MFAAFENVSIHHLQEDRRIWGLDSSGAYTCKSYFKWLANDPSQSNFKCFNFNWKAIVPPKIRFFAWVVALGKLNTGEIIQRRFPHTSLSPSFCITCKHSEESIYCDVAFNLWSKVLKEAKICWVALLLAIKFLRNIHVTLLGERKQKLFGGVQS